MSDVVDVFARDIQFAEIDGPARKAPFRRTAEVHDDLDQILQVGLPVQRVADVWRHDAQK